MLSADVEADLRRVLRSVWRRRGLIIALIALGGLLGMAASLISTRYVSEGVLLTPAKMGLQEFKKYQTAMLNEARLREFLALQDSVDEEDGTLLVRTVRLPSAFAAAVRPEFAFTQQDVRDFGVNLEESPRLVGLRLSLAQQGKERQGAIKLLEEYVRDSIIKLELDSVLLENCQANSIRQLELRNGDLQADFRLTQLQARAEALRKILQDVPGSGDIEQRQVVSLEKGGERFLSPTTQLVGTEMEIAELEIARQERERDRAASALRKNYYCSARRALSEDVLGRNFFTRLVELRRETFAKEDLTEAVVEETYNAIDVEWQNWTNTYLNSLRFIAEPKSGEIPVRRPGLVVSTVLGAILGGLLGVLLALSTTWWRHNRNAILRPDGDD